MKKLCSIIIIILICLSICISKTSNDKIKYYSWKDTIKSFGDGTYQVLHQVTDVKTAKQLVNIKHNQCVITDIEEYTEIDKIGCFVGKYHNLEVYAVLDVEKNLLRYYVNKGDKEEFLMVYLSNMLDDKQIELIETYDDFTEEEKIIFENLENWDFK